VFRALTTAAFSVATKASSAAMSVWIDSNRDSPARPGSRDRFAAATSLRFSAVGAVRGKGGHDPSAEDKIRIVLEGLRGEDSIAELCRGDRPESLLSLVEGLS
jgi:hypothetical protein